MMRRKLLLIILVSAFLLNLGFQYLSATAQAASGQKTLQHEVSVTLKLIQVYVTDKNGNPVVDLDKQGFIVYDNGKKQILTEFEKHILQLPLSKAEMLQESPSPEPRELMNRKLFLFFDFAYNNPRGISQAKKAAIHFIDTQLQPSDEVGVLSYSAIKSITLHEFLTTDHAKVRQVVDSFGVRDSAGRAENFEEEYWREVTNANPLDASQQGRITFNEGIELVPKTTSSASPEFTKFQTQGDSRAQAMAFAKKMGDLSKALRYIPGYKHFIFFSSGIPYALLYGIQNPSGTFARENWGETLLRQRYEDLLKELSDSNITVYTLDTEDLASTIAVDSRVKGGFTLQTMASETGGKYFGDINNYEKHIEKIQNMTGCFYILGYYVDEKWDGKYHELKVKVGRPGCNVHAQKGYFNPKPFSKYSELEKMLHLVDLALSENPLFQSPVRFALEALPCSVQGKTGLALFSEIQTEEIRESTGDEVEVMNVIFDGQDNIVRMERDETDFSRLPKRKIYHYSFLPLDPGNYKCRLVIRNLETGKGAVASSSAIVLKDPGQGIKIYPPLLLKPEIGAFYLNASPNVYAFDSNQYAPLVQGLEQGTESVMVVVRCSFFGIPQPEIQLSANLIHNLAHTGRKIPVNMSILSRSDEDHTVIFLVELQTGELEAGEYFLHLFAVDKLSQSRSRASTVFKVR